MNLDIEDSNHDYHPRRICEEEAPWPQSFGRRVEEKYKDLEAKVNGIGHNLAQLLEVINQQSHLDKEPEDVLVRDTNKGKALMIESMGGSHPHHSNLIGNKVQGKKQRVEGESNPQSAREKSKIEQKD